jgi:hypothetical protein
MSVWFKTMIFIRGTADVVGLGVILISIYQAIEKPHYVINILKIRKKQINGVRY